MTRRRRRRPPRSDAGDGPPIDPTLTELVLIDGDNLLHRVRGTRDEAGIRWLLPRLRGWLPSGTRAIVMLDGHPDPHEPLRSRVAPGVEFRHSGGVDGDTALLALLDARVYAERSRTLLVTDDRSLTERARSAGGLTRRLDWLVAGLAAGPSGRGRPAAAAPPASGTTGIGRPPPRRPPHGPDRDEA